ncbi:nucleotide-binding protein [Mesorhizobium sp. M0833]|uniref:TIR domain-containing protein n=1 Tax=Mesorhizobium sp. M0833 TaxID=2957009 RepID=UPI00333E0607
MDGQELIDISDRLDRLAAALEANEITASLKRVGGACEEIGRAWSGSNLGYHSTVYYAGFARPPAGAHFSMEAGLGEEWPLDGSTGDWREYRFEDVIAEIERRSGDPDLQETQKQSRAVEQAVQDAKQTIASMLAIFLRDNPDAYLEDIKRKVGDERILTEQEGARIMIPSGQIMTRDRRALQQGMRLAPHQGITLKTALIGAPAIVAHKIADLARQAGSHLSRLEYRKRKTSLVGTNVFIGHGRSLLWRSLKDFIHGRLHLPVDEFNRVPAAGVTNIARLSEMLESAAIAFVILTAEDEMRDGKHQARMNVIHEVGLFQGRLGFTKAVVMLEDGCEEFSNIQGLGQIRFPTGNIDAAFEEVRRVLEREGLVEPY